LVKNGGFEARGTKPGSPFQYWKEVNPNLARVNNDPALTNIAYEGLSAARFESMDTVNEENKSVTLQQTVTVTPGCIYKLSFAENLLFKGNGTAAAVPTLTARLIYMDNAGNPVDLVVVPIFKFSQEHDPNRGYTFHEAVAYAPVPCDVTELIVRFDYFENSTTGSIWLLDGVSLRAAFSVSACCRNHQRSIIKRHW